MTIGTNVIGLIAAASVVAGLSGPTNAAPQVITLDGAYLEYAKARVAEKDPALMPSHEKLMLDAAALLAVEPEAVTRKTVIPPSGDKHDYLSLAPYWWPDPSKPNGLPYIQKDGQFNPSAKNADTDSVRMQLMCLGTHYLSLAYYFSGEEKFAKKTADFIRTWFLDPATRMNPSLRFAQAVMGRVDGRGIGLIDTRNFWMVIDAVPLIEASGALTPAEVADLKTWFKTFVEWMLTSDIGIEEFNQFNNHGTYYDMQVAAYALFSGDTDLARKTVRRGIDLRIAGQVAADGKQHAELERTTPFHYVAFNLDAMTHLARYGEHVKLNVWKAREKTRGLLNAINFIVPYAANPSTWPYKELKSVETELALPVLLRAERAYGGGTYAEAAAKLPVSEFDAQEFIALHAATKTPFPTTVNSIDRLVWPVMKK